ncbi:potassium channel family protein [Solicola sp. PLA-1-18]|uniref:potassium channel family protein n=1 Tax=Solicola sp. PLA-1-18 TaxID=3380532 RepID=UPI003B788F67
MTAFWAGVRDWHSWDDRVMDGMLWLTCSTRRILLAGILNVVVCGEAYALIEGTGPIEGPYWAVVTGTSTGYGDFSPASTPGRFVAMFLMISMLMVWVPLWTAHLVGERDRRTGDAWSHDEQQELLDAVRRLVVQADGTTAASQHPDAPSTERPHPPC